MLGFAVQRKHSAVEERGGKKRKKGQLKFAVYQFQLLQGAFLSRCAVKMYRVKAQCRGYKTPKKAEFYTKIQMHLGDVNS